jgi:transposase
MVAVLRAELGDVTRFERADQVVAYAGLDIAVRQSGKWRGEAKLSKRGSGRLRRILYMTAVRCIRRKRLRLWAVLPSPLDPWHETPCCPGRRHAKDAPGGLSVATD